MANQILRLGLMVVAVALVGVLVWDFGFNGDHDTILGATGFVVAAATFYGMMSLGDAIGGRWSLNKSGMRTAIAATVIVTYLYMVTVNTFVVPPKEMAAITKALIDSFTSVVTVTVTFYFGAETVLQVLERRDEKNPPSKEP